MTLSSTNRRQMATAQLPAGAVRAPLVLILLTILGLSYRYVAAFGPTRRLTSTSTACTARAPAHVGSNGINRNLLMQRFSTASTEADKDQEDPATMRLGEIQAELKGMKISYADCFDKESLVKRLKDARAGLVQPPTSEEGNEKKEEVEKTETDSTETMTEEAKRSSSSSSSSSSSGSRGTSKFDREAVLSDLRSLRVKELRTRLSERSIRWAGLLEKEDLVRALADAMERASNFSPSGALEPGKVADITDDQLAAEIKLAKGVGTPLLLDVYATWCGPCQMMAPQLAAAAAELGETVRVAKIDSDKYPQWASQLRVGGLPTVLVFNAEGNEVNRVEGALMKDGLLDLVRQHI